jgi:hypothetical protein
MAWDIGICAILLRWKRRSVYFSTRSMHQQGRPRWLAAGRCGSMCLHSASERSVGYVTMSRSVSHHPLPHLSDSFSSWTLAIHAA